MTSKRYVRQVALADVGEAGQARIGAGGALVVGLGGLGCPAAQFLASSGIGRLVLNDFDRVDETNLPRQILYTAEDVGKLKVDAAAARLHALNPLVAVTTLAERLDERSLAAAVESVDVVLDGSDNFATRFAVNRACVELRKPLVSGAAVRLEGQIAVFPNRAGEPCYSCLYDDEDEWLGDCQGNGVLAPVPGVIGTLMAAEALKLLLGWESALHGRLLLWDAKRGEWQGVKLERDPDCEVCRAR
ncbi:MAG TPA: HesA/MoeB/ThiF family protein [Gammaproteobacteria bacterium]|nr:HesA/MoeB/ThiF family protein [Gammaproteobacteria bacterium]